jgi:hypothetical protein
MRCESHESQICFVFNAHDAALYFRLDMFMLTITISNACETIMDAFLLHWQYWHTSGSLDILSLIFDRRTLFTINPYLFILLYLSV